MPSILLTGFEPFGGSQLNPAAEAVHILANERDPGFQLYTDVLPVDSQAAPERLRAALLRYRPDWCLMLGQADGRAALSVERVAVNICDFTIPDNRGAQLIDQPVVPGGPDGYFVTAPTRALRQAALAAGVPAELSLSAGAYLCNMVLYIALHTCAEARLPTGCGFIHLPSLPAQLVDARQPRPTMALETICAGLRAMLGELAASATSQRSLAAD